MHTFAPRSTQDRACLAESLLKTSKGVSVKFFNDLPYPFYVLHFINKRGQPAKVPMCILYCFDVAATLSGERVYIDESRMRP